MPSPTTTELKKALIGEGFEIYRTLGTCIVLADRVRDNLIMDSGVSAVSGDSLRCRFVMRAQRNDFPGESEDQLFQRVRSGAAAALQLGYTEVEANVVPVFDPGDKNRTLDTFFEVAFEKTVAALPELFDELRYALSLDKTTSRA